MQWVGQQKSRDCGVAVLAMLTGHSYGTVAAYFAAVDLDKNGLYLRGIDDYLTDHGFAIARKNRYLGFFGENGAVERTPWPPVPFGDMHLCEVEVVVHAPVFHFVAMRADGTCLDPLTTKVQCLDDYYRVNSVAVVVRRP